MNKNIQTVFKEYGKPVQASLVVPEPKIDITELSKKQLKEIKDSLPKKEWIVYKTNRKKALEARKEREKLTKGGLLVVVGTMLTGLVCVPLIGVLISIVFKLLKIAVGMKISIGK